VEGDHIAEIRNLAYALYEERGHVDGRDLDDWLEAEDIILQRGKTAACPIASRQHLGASLQY